MFKKIFFVLILVVCGSFVHLKYDNREQPLQNYPRLSDTSRLKQDLIAILNTPRPRNYRNTDILDTVAAYIQRKLLETTPSVSEQKFEVLNRSYKNIIASFGPKDAPRIIVGAHYDVCGDQNGADDNASAVAGLLELARLLHNHPLKYRYDLVAYSLEEPPFFRTENMGSYVHAASLKAENAKVKGMVCLEMIGYFSDEDNSQDYPVGFLKSIYGKKGNFITVVNKFGGGVFAQEFTKNMLSEQTLRTKKFQSFAALPGVDFSDHLNYWALGYSAVMITDTSFYRNKNYHKKSDTLNTLDIGKMGLVVDGVFRALIKM